MEGAVRSPSLVSVVFVAREALSVVLGVKSAIPVTSWMPACSNSSMLYQIPVMPKA